MKGLGKKAVALAAVAAMSMTSFVGCADNSVDNSKVVATVGDSEITLGLVNFYIRYQQSAVESYYASTLGDNMWTLEISDGYTYEDSVKESIIDSLEQLYILEDHAEEYEVALTEEELAEIETVAETFDAANEDAAKELISADKETVVDLLELLTLGNKVTEAMIADVDTEVSDEEAAQKALSYMFYSKSITNDDGETVEKTEEEIAAAKVEAEDFLAQAKANGSLATYAESLGLEASTATFDSESTSPTEEVVAAADKLAENEFAEIIETDYGFYVVQLTSLLDEEATATKKEEIVAERQDEKFNELYEAWLEETEITLNENVLDDISLHRLQVTAKTEE